MLPDHHRTGLHPCSYPSHPYDRDQFELSAPHGPLPSAYLSRRFPAIPKHQPPPLSLSTSHRHRNAPEQKQGEPQKHHSAASFCFSARSSSRRQKPPQRPPLVPVDPVEQPHQFAHLDEARRSLGTAQPTLTVEVRSSSHVPLCG